MAEHSQNLSEKKVWGLEVPSSWSCVHAAGTCRQRQGWWSNLASFQLIQDSDLSWQCLQELSHWEAAMSGAVMLNLEITPQGTSVKTVPLKPASMVPTTSPEWYLPAHLPVWALGWPDPVSRPAGREFFFFFFLLSWAEISLSGRGLVIFISETYFLAFTVFTSLKSDLWTTSQGG